ncbi:hypothetical protein DITRI_Ditri03aG0206000 [Diplodiscus trichospermus]
MKIIVWNVRGLNNPLKQKEIIGRIKKIKAGLVCLLETRVKQHKMQEIVDRHFPGWGIIHDYSLAPNGRIWMLWNGNLQVDLADITDPSITCRIQIDSQPVLFSSIYGSNHGMERRRLWDHLLSLHSTIDVGAWVLAGDFNIIAHPSESSDFNGSQVITSDMREFIDCQSRISVSDHAYIGSFFTWTNNQHESFLARKLDRVLINDDWYLRFPHSRVEFLPPEISDHCLALIQLQQVSESPPKPFKFFNFWTKHTQFLNVVQQSCQRPRIWKSNENFV